MNYQFQNMFRQIQPKTNIGIRTPWQEQIAKPRDDWGGLRFERQQETIPEEPPQDENNFINALKQLQEGRKGEASSRYRELLGQAPREEDYERSKWAKIAGVLVGGLDAYNGNPNAADDMVELLNSPYRRALSQYDRDVKLAGANAELEQNDWKQNYESLKTQYDWQDRERDNIRQDEAQRVTAGNATVSRANMESQIADRAKRGLLVGKELQQNKITGELELIDLLDGSRMSIGQYAESVEQDDARKRDMARFTSGLTEGRQKRVATFGNELPQKPQNPMQTPSSTELGHAEATVEAELAMKPEYKILFKTEQGKTFMVPEPAPRGGTTLSPGNEQDIARWKFAKAKFDAEKARLVDQRLGYTINRFGDIQGVK